MVDRTEVNQMARMIAILNGQSVEAPKSANGVSTPSTQVSTSTSDPGIAAMKSILQAYRGSPSNTADNNLGRATRNLVEDSKTNRSLREAMATETTDDGARIGDWEIKVRKDAGRKFFDVVSTDGQTTIASDLTLYEAAYGIARSLDENLPITSQIIRDLLRAEEEYAGALNDAIHHKHSLASKKLVESRRAILEDRYDSAKTRALSARSRIEKLVGPLPF